MKNILISIDDALKEIKYKTISEIIDNKEKCSQYISDVLERNGFFVSATANSVKEILDFRIKHVLLTFGLGVLFSKFGTLREKIESTYQVYTKKYKGINERKISFAEIWLAVCLYHDYGYFIFDDHKECALLDDIKVENSIFQDQFGDMIFKAFKKTNVLNCSRYTKQLYEEYYRVSYIRNNKNDKRKDIELGDHGILGGYVLFDRLYSYENKPIGIKDVLKSNIDSRSRYFKIFKIERHLTPFYRDICYRIMEHNIWKGEAEFYKQWNGDLTKLSEILGDSFKLIIIEEPLLYLLSIVDTVEYIKYFCTYSDKDSDEMKNIWPSTVSKRISVDVSTTEINLSFSELQEFLNKRSDILNTDDWEHSIIELSNWMKIKTKRDGKSIIIY